MKFFITIFAVCLLCPCGFAQAQTDAPFQDDVRGFIWGVGKEDVKEFERVVLFEEVESALFFIDEQDGVKILVGYEFWNDKLIRASIDFQRQNYTDPARAIEFYVARELALNEKLGVEGVQDTFWKNDYYLNMPNQFPLAVLNGHVDLVTTWQTPRSDVVMGMMAQDFEYTHRITYESRALIAQRAQAQAQARDNATLLAPPPLTE